MIISRKVLEFSFYPEGSNEGRNTTSPFICKVCSTFSGQHNSYSKICGGNKDLEFSFCPLVSYEGLTMIFSVIQGLSLELLYTNLICSVPSLVEIGPVFLKKTSSLQLLSPIENGMALHLNKLESCSRRTTLCQVWWNLNQ